MQRLGKYEIVSELGRGGMGVVYKARDPLINRLVALKTLNSNLIARPDLHERFLQEARSAGALEHPNIVTIYELGEQSGAPFIAMEYIDGETLEAMIQRKAALPLALKLGYVLRVSEGLQYAHEHGVIHRDIKPGNIMVNSSGVAKVVDFGIARVMDTSMTQSNLVLGSRSYMAPQLYQGARADAGSDIWALGATLYELVANQKPFVAETEAALMYKVLQEAPLPLRELCPDCPEALENLVKKMLEKSKSARYQGMAEVVRALGTLWKQLREEAVQKLMVEARQSMESSDFQGARELLLNSLQMDAGNLTAKRLLDQVAKELHRQEMLPRLQEHLDRGRIHLTAGRIGEAREEFESALELDPDHEAAKQFLGEIDEAEKRAEVLNQLLRVAKQRLVEGSLADAQQAIEQAKLSGAEDSRVQILSTQIAEEQARRQRRKELTELKNRARGLWVDLKYAECLDLLNVGIDQFPGESELLKLRETARQDWAEHEKQQYLGQIRKLLGQQEFAQARAILEKLEKEHPHDSALTNLRRLVEEGEAEIGKRQRLAEKLMELRGLVREEQYSQAVKQGEALLREFQHDIELKEVVGFAQAELAQQQLRGRKQELAKRIQELLQTRRYAEAATAAQGAVREFAGDQQFQKLCEEAELKRKEHAIRDEFQRRIQEIQRKITRQELTDAIDLAQQTLTIMGPDRQVTQLLLAARLEHEEKCKRGRQDLLDAVQKVVQAGKGAEATRILNDAFTTQILQPSDPGVQNLIKQINGISTSPVTRPRQPTSSGDRPANAVPPTYSGSELPPEPSLYSATNVLSQTPPPKPAAPESIVIHLSEQAYPSKPGESAAPGQNVASPHGRISTDPMAGIPSSRPTSIRKAKTIPRESKWDLSGPAAVLKRFAVPMGQSVRNVSAGARRVLEQCLEPLKQLSKLWAAVTAGIVLVIVGSAAIGLHLWKTQRESRRVSSIENDLRSAAVQAWDQHEFDQSEEKWKQLQSMHGQMENDAAQQVAIIETKRTEERQLYEDGNRLLQKDENDPAGRQNLQKVVEFHLWHAADAQDILKNLDEHAHAANTLSDQEQSLFAQGERSFKNGNYDDSMRRFRDLLNLQIPNSSLRPKAQDYLAKIKALNDDKKNYAAALKDLQNENWDTARNGFRAIVDHRGALKDEAQKQLDMITSSQAALNEVSEMIRSHSYRAAKGKLDSMQDWPKSSGRLRQELTATEQQEFISIKSRSQSLFQKQDISGLEHLQGELDSLSSQTQDAAALQTMEEFSRTLSSQLLQLKKAQSTDKAAFEKAEKDFQQARSAGEINTLGSEVRNEFEQIARGNGFNSVSAEAYVITIIPDTIKELASGLAAKGKAVVPPLACNNAPSERPKLENKGQPVPCDLLDAASPLRWIGNPTVDVPPGAKQAGKLPYILHLIVVVDGTGKVLRVDKDGQADADFLKKAKDAARRWKSSAPMLNGKPVNATFPIAITFLP